VFRCYKSLKSQFATLNSNYADSTVLDMLTDKKANVAVTTITGNPSRISKLSMKKFVSQYPDLHIVESKDYHDRFI
jgi:hypothetical protein